jgi:ApaG protein
MNLNNPIEIAVKTQYIKEQSDPESDRFIFAYTIRITNKSEKPVTLKNRRWLITNADNSKIEVNGDGVVGQQPLIAPDQQYEYNSGVVLTSPVGTMEGHYGMERENGEVFDAPIPAFLLAVPHAVN